MSAVDLAGLLVAVGFGCVVATIVLPFLVERVNSDAIWLGFIGLFVAGVLAMLVLNVNIDHIPAAQGIHGIGDVALYILTFPVQVVGSRANGSWLLLGVVGGVVGAWLVSLAMQQSEPPASDGG